MLHKYFFLKSTLFIFLCCIVCCILIASCNSPYVSKKRGYFNIQLPVRNYQKFDNPDYPYSFEYPVYAEILKDSLFFDKKAENPYWINVSFPRFNGKIYISYKEVGKNNFDSLVNDAFTMFYKQNTFKASSIEPTPFTTPNKLNGIYFSLKGNTATANQFFITDSSRHFL